MRKKEFINSVHNILRLNGFCKLGARFRKSLDEITIIIDLQKSSWSNSYYINVGFFVNQTIQGNEKNLKAYQGCVKARICQGTSELINGELVNSQSFDLDSPSYSVELVEKQLSEEITSKVLPVRCLDDIRAIVLQAQDNCFGPYIVTAAAMEFFQNADP